jgi:Phosphotransferase enzyme family
VPDKRWPVLARKLGETVGRHGPALGPDGYAALRLLVVSLGERFAAIDACGLPDTLAHGDFHAGNARSDGDHRTLIDWGDSFIGHPGFDARQRRDGEQGGHAPGQPPASAPARAVNDGAYLDSSCPI